MIVGIDLGTTNSLVAIWKDGKPVLIPNSLGQALTPSVVSVDERGEVLVGAAALERQPGNPRSTVAAFKRWMGTSRLAEVDGKTFRPEELSSLVLRSLKADAEAVLGEGVHEAVITVPAYFNDSQRQATRVAGQLAGLKVERLLNEPTAAALAYGLHEISNEKRFLIFDLGGGTFDVSILEYFDGVMEVHASAGDNYLGGEDFVDVLADCWLGKHKRKRSDLTPEALGLLRAQCERAKRQLSSRDSAEIKLILKGKELAAPVERTEFEKVSQPLLARLGGPCERALRDAKLTVRDIDEVVLVGGATRMPMISRLVTQMFGRLPLRHINPDEVVGLGAAVQAGLKARDAALKETVLTDVCPYTLGVEVSNQDAAGQYVSGIFAPLIERNVTIPTSRSSTFYPIKEEQQYIELNVYQGESRLVEENIFLGKLRVALGSTRREENGVDVRFTYDINGLLQVEATVLKTGARHELIIQQNPNRLSDEEVKQCLQRLAHLKIHPRDQDVNRVPLERAKRLYEEYTGDVRATIGQWIDAFQLLLQKQDPRDIEAYRAKLVEALDALEDNPLK